MAIPVGMVTDQVYHNMFVAGVEQWTLHHTSDDK